MEPESWEVAPGSRGRYLVSDRGRVQFVKRNGATRLRKLKLEGHGYLSFDMRVEGGRKVYHRVHRLVALLFVPNPEKKPEVNHKDGNRTHNCANNLEWADRSDQMRHVYHILKNSNLNRGP